MTPSVRSLGLLAGLSLALGSGARGATSLAATSPFLPPDGSAAAAGENAPLELRGILADGAGYRFSVYDPIKRTGQWVRLNEAGHDFTVRTHDVAGDAVTVDYQGRVLTLPLRSAKVVGLSVSAPEPSANPRPTVIGSRAGPGPVPKPPTPEESARFSRAVEEINRRRALREKGPVPTPPQATHPSPGPATK